ncbi:uncharacterized protein LOC122264936 [Penaeus japonicus]|uniref:uncharacterized protein LOC122264936 n=1 Tax=Penaeus japonicus TaxID=27405 RepID=UPI001C70B1D8|nr:uncharacterized protein LOC122264936 [Penaeus japonicus]
MKMHRFPPMASYAWLLILAFVEITLAYDENICVPPTDTCGPIAPSPPKSYVTHIEEVDQLYKTTSYVNEFYDPLRQIMAVERTTRGTKDHAIFFYETDTAVIIQYRSGTDDVRPHVDCVVAEIEDAAPWLIGYDKNGTYAFMLSPSEALFYGGDYKYTYVDNDPVRQVPCNRWDSCIETYGNGTMNVQYHWTDQTRLVDVTDYSHERPVMAHAAGYYYSPRGENKQIDVDMIYNFGFFDDNPDWAAYQWAMEIPSSLYCPGLPAGKAAPTRLADTYSMRVEVTMETSLTKGKEFVSTVKNWYDYERKITRADFIPDPFTTEGYYVGFNEAAVIRDFRSGIEYIIDKGLGNCTAITIPDTGYDTIVDPSGQVTIKDPLTLFGLGQVSNLTYYGKKTARGLPCDVWVGRLDQQVDNTTLDEKLTYEIYFLEEGWHEDAGSEPLPDKLYPDPILIKIQQDFTSPSNPEYTTFYALEQNIFKFDQGALDMTVFDITPCFKGHDHIRRFQMAFPGEFRDDFDRNPDKFIRSIHGTLEVYLSVPSIRIQHMEVEFNERDGRLYCEFTLVDQPPVEGIDYPPAVGPPLEDVVASLEASMKNLVVFLFDESYDVPGHMKQMKAYEDSLREMFEDSCHPLKSSEKTVDDTRKSDRSQKELRDPQKDKRLSENPSKKTDHAAIRLERETLIKEKADAEPVIADNISKESFMEKLRNEMGRFSYYKMTRSAPMYTPGDMAGMGIGMFFLGLLLGTVAMLALLQKFGLSEGMEFIPMNSRRS